MQTTTDSLKGSGYHQQIATYWERAICFNRTGHAPNKNNLDADMEAAVAASLAAGAAKDEIAVVCHEARGIEVVSGRQPYFSVMDLRDREVKYSPMGTMCSLRCPDPETKLLLRVCVDDPEDDVQEQQRRIQARYRVLGEVRIPLRHIVQQYNACLYYTWMTLEMPGLHDSVQSLGDFVSDDAALDQAIRQGPKQLSQAKACISICRTLDIGSAGKIMWSVDAPRESRYTMWGPLLRSHEQHVVMTAALHLKNEREGLTGSQDSSSSTSKALIDENERMKAELESMRAKLRDRSPTPRSSNASLRGGPDSARIAELEARLAESEAAEQRANERSRAANVEAEEARDRCEQFRSQGHAAELELDKMSAEANDKIVAANDRIRTLRKRVEEAEQEVNRYKSTTVPQLNQEKSQLEEAHWQLEEEKATLEQENCQLYEQKDALLRIVEDLHQTCRDAGLDMAGRSSIDNTLMGMNIGTAHSVAPSEQGFSLS